MNQYQRIDKICQDHLTGRQYKYVLAGGTFALFILTCVYAAESFWGF